MAVRWIEGFELNGQSHYLERKLRNVSGSIVLTGGHRTGSALTSSTLSFDSPEFADQDVWIVNWWWKFESVEFGSQDAAVELTLDGDAQLSVVPRSYNSVDQDDRYYVDIKRGGTTLATVGPYWANEWHSFQLKATIDPSSGGYELKVDDVSEVTGSGANTANEGVANADGVHIDMGNGTHNMQIDHIVVADDTGGENDDFLGELLVQAALPISDGDDTDWLPSSGSDHYALVNEAGSGVVVDTEDQKRVRSYTPGDDDLFSFTDMAAAFGLPTSHQVVAVSLETSARMDNSGSRTLQPRYKHSGGSDDIGAAWVVNDTEFATQTEIWDSDPVAAATWTLALLTAGQFGVRLQS